MSYSMKFLSALTIAYLFGVMTSWAIFDGIGDENRQGRLTTSEKKVSHAELMSLQAENAELSDKIIALQIRTTKKIRSGAAAEKTLLKKEVVNGMTKSNDKGLEDNQPQDVLKHALPLASKWDAMQTLIELENVLDLTEDQAAELTELLTQKSNAELTIFHEIETQQRLDEKALMSLLETSQQRFEQKANNLLSPQQIEKYKQYEQSKLELDNRANHEFAKLELFEVIPTLDSYQKAEITRFFSENAPLSGDAKIGTQGTMALSFQQSYTEEALNTHLGQFLNPEQLEAYQYYLKRLSEESDFYP